MWSCHIESSSVWKVLYKSKLTDVVSEKSTTIPCRENSHERYLESESVEPEVHLLLGGERQVTMLFKVPVCEM